MYASLGFLLERTFDVGVTLLTTALALSLMTGIDLASIEVFPAIACVTIFNAADCPIPKASASPADAVATSSVWSFDTPSISA